MNSLLKPLSLEVLHLLRLHLLHPHPPFLHPRHGLHLHHERMN
uniref:Uncharacterized protein n=1 Tax=Lepeophtheirus salmonis TaxID=72036 RepID=A0A0K2VGZ9_LEPSM